MKRKQKSVPMTKEVVLKIKALLKENLHYQHVIAVMCQVNPGRVSETKHGKYDYLLK